MSIDIERVDDRLDNCNSNTTDFELLFGKVFITNLRELVLRCARCNKRHRDYEDFLEHIYTHYYAEEEDSYNQQLDSYEAASSSDETALNEADSTEQVLATQIFKVTEPPLSESKFPARSDEIAAKHPERRHACDVCGIAFKDVSNMRAHRRRHTGCKNFFCVQCNKGFYTRNELTRHEVRHRGERPHVCAYCGQNFKTIGTLSNHERRHTTEPAHKCTGCAKSFYDAAELRRHMVVHTQERNHSCHICHGRFARQKSLKQHIKLHLNAREYACDMCEKAFNQLPALLSHKKNKHKVIGAKVSSIETIQCFQNND